MKKQTKYTLKRQLALLFLTTAGLLGSCESDIETVDVSADDETTRRGEVPCESAFSINLDATDCTEDIQALLGIASIYEETNDGTIRSVIVNNIPSHLAGQFPNAGNPNVIGEVDSAYEMTMSPTLADSTTGTGGYISGVLFSGVGLEVQTAETYVNVETGEANRDWNIVALQSTRDLGLDCNNAHVQPTGQYHYHGSPSAYVEDLRRNGRNGRSMIKLGYAGDGFPIYYKYGYANNGRITSFESGYRLINGERPGDGVTAPDGCYDGTYSQDYEYVEGVSQLDACNGRTGRTPESRSEYYYVITDNWPSAPICFSGTPDPSFSFRGQGGGGGDDMGGGDDDGMGEERTVCEALAEGPTMSSEHGPMDNADLNRDGMVLREELETFMDSGEYRRITLLVYFDIFDVDMDGSIDGNIIGGEFSEVEPTSGFDGSDLDADCIVTREEIITYAAEEGRSYRQIGLGAFFELVDTDGDEIATAEEIEAAHVSGLLARF